MSDRELNNWIRQSEFMGLPGDIVAHFLIGALIGWVIYLLFGSDRKAIIFIFIAAIAKELLFDLYANVVQGLVFEPIKDIVISVIGALLILFVLRRPFKVRSQYK